MRPSPACVLMLLLASSGTGTAAPRTHSRLFARRDVAQLPGCAAASAPLALAAAQAAAAGDAAAESPRDGSHDMDFGAGHWRTDVTIFKEPFNPAGATIHMAGTKNVIPVWGGKAWLEEIEADGPQGHWRAANLFTYDPTAHQWINYYADSEEGRFGVPHFGEKRGDIIEFDWQDVIGGKTMLMRGVWKDFAANSHTYEVARSDDGGKSWHTSFIARVSRAQP